MKSLNPKAPFFVTFPEESISKHLVLRESLRLRTSLAAKQTGDAHEKYYNM